MEKERIAIHCERTDKLLAYRNEHGMWLWCKLCKTEHYIPWKQEESKETDTPKVATGADLCYNMKS